MSSAWRYGMADSALCFLSRYRWTLPLGVLSWSVDGGAVADYTFGPGNIAENQQFDGTRTVMDVIRLGPGTHTLTPEVRLSGNSTTSGIVDRLCVVAEANTK